MKKCNNCGNIFDSEYSCPLCGFTDFVIMDNNTYDKVNNEISNEEVVLDNNKINKHAGLFNICVIFSIIICISLCVFGIFSQRNVFVADVDSINRDKFDNYFKDMGYRINDLKESFENYSYLDNYVVASFNNRSVIYITSSDINTLDNLSESIKNTINKYKIDDNDILVINSGNLEKYILESENKYAIFVRVDDMLMYSIVDLKYKDNLNNMIDELGYKINEEGRSYIYFLVSFVIMFIIFLISLWKIFVKTGRRGYYSLIPIYNLYLFNKIVMYNGWLFILMFIPVINILYLIRFNYKLGKLFGKGMVYIFGLIIFPIYFVFALSNDNSVYLGIKR